MDSFDSFDEQDSLHLMVMQPGPGGNNTGNGTGPGGRGPGGGNGTRGGRGGRRRGDNIGLNCRGPADLSEECVNSYYYQLS